ncbi:ketosteroid isomerase-like protein [Silvibacterium bohemicum]|uniref:Ketosteroid isomerase-like protein n=1 Tax=Silvibacterium bohemicum TaxID=1577686 RepID=A0A841K480_9BACT|nr:nuclear transport factor 2 family protein [Silvibacterium bohemicum]MBB6145961.1 ketosteroid isomerase-like protein [Silvibacterium bohemicum]
MMKKLAGAILLFVSVTGFAQTHSEEAEIRTLRVDSNSAIAKGDITAFASSLSDDFVMVRGSGAFSTRAAYIEAFAADFKNPTAVRYERFTDSVEISSAAPLAAEHGHWIGKFSDGRAAYGGTYLAMWRHSTGGWKIRSELFVLLSCDDPAVCDAYRKTAEASTAK